MLKPKIASFVAYWGPADSGKAETIRGLYAGLPAELRHDPPAISTPKSGGPGHTLFVDVTPPWLPEVGGRRLTFRVATVPGRVWEEDARNELLDHADSFVLVLDARPERMDASEESAENLIWALAERGRKLSDHCVALQLSIPGGAANPQATEVANRFAGALPSLAGQRLYPVDPQTGNGCDLALKHITVEKYNAIKAMVDHGVLVPS